MTDIKAARQCCSTTTPKTSTTRDVNSLTEYDRATLIAGVIIGIAFGLMFVIGAWMQW